MITADQLLSAGYRKWPERFKLYSKFFYQKRFDDVEGKKYFIQFYEYDNRDFYRKRGYKHDSDSDFTYSSDAQFKDRHGNTFNVECLTNDSIEQVEEFFESVWSLLKLEHYEKWEK